MADRISVAGRLPDGHGTAGLAQPATSARQAWRRAAAHAVQLSGDHARVIPMDAAIRWASVLRSSRWGSPTSEAPAFHEVVAGDSHWAIAESVLGDRATPSQVLAETNKLIELNSPRLGYDDPQMLLPGDVVYLDREPTNSTSMATGQSAARRRQTPTSPPLSEQMIVTSPVTKRSGPVSTRVVNGMAPAVVAAGAPPTPLVATPPSDN